MERGYRDLEMVLNDLIRNDVDDLSGMASEDIGRIEAAILLGEDLLNGNEEKLSKYDMGSLDSWAKYYRSKIKPLSSYSPRQISSCLVAYMRELYKDPSGTSWDMPLMPEEPADSMPRSFKIAGRLRIAHNGCCKGREVLITVNPCSFSKERPEGYNFSCQCSCGAWCTNGHATPGGALDEYYQMCRRKMLETQRGEQGNT